MNKYFLNIKGYISNFRENNPFAAIILSIALIFLLLLYFSLPSFYNYENFDKEIQKKVSDLLVIEKEEAEMLAKKEAERLLQEKKEKEEAKRLAKKQAEELFKKQGIKLRKRVKRVTGPHQRRISRCSQEIRVKKTLLNPST